MWYSIQRYMVKQDKEQCKNLNISKILKNIKDLYLKLTKLKIIYRLINGMNKLVSFFTKKKY